MWSGPNYSVNNGETYITEEVQKKLTAMAKFEPLQSVVSVAEFRDVHRK